MRNRFYRVDCQDIIECPKDADYSETQLYEFLNKIIPKTGDAFFIQRQMDYNSMLGDEKAVFFSKHKSRSDFINHLIFATEQQEYTVFYTANSYINTRGHTAKYKNGMKTKSLVIDIDGIEGIEELNEKNIEEFLKREYFVAQNQLPNYICFSGHGLHLYYILSEETDNDDFRKEVHKQLVKLFFADASCVPFCHCFRVPCSYNLKNNSAIKSRLYKTSNETTYLIDEFDWIDDILESEEYFEKIATKTKKSEAEKTEIINNKTDEKINQNSEINFQENNSEKPEKIISETAEKINEDILNFNSLNYKNHNEANSRNKHLLIDLHNYYVRHNGLVVGVRHNFFMIMANVLKNNKITEGEAQKFINKYISESHSFYPEALADLTRVYSSDRTYKYKNETIADWLNFT